MQIFMFIICIHKAVCTNLSPLMQIYSTSLPSDGNFNCHCILKMDDVTADSITMMKTQS